MAKELTEQQKEDLRIWYDKWMQIGLSTDPADRPRFEKAVTEIYRRKNLEVPPIYWVGSLKAAQQKIAELEGTDKPKEWVSTPLWGALESYWIAFYLFAESIGIKYSQEDSEMLKLWAEIAQSSWPWWAYEEAIVVCDRPAELHINLETGQLDNFDGPAVRFRDGEEEYVIEGIFFDKRVVMTPEDMSVQEILDESNAERRRILLRKYGEGKFLEQSGATVVDEISEDDETYAFGLRGAKLFRAALANDPEDLVMVRLLNSSLNYDGSRDIYWIRVPPTTRTVVDAVAGHHRLPVKMYKPVEEA